MKHPDYLIEKYNVPAPRYTSYPTVPLWDLNSFSREKWYEAVKRIFKESNQDKGISLYIHLPFCEKLCTYCGCNKRITRNHQVEDGYIETLLQEWQQYLTIFTEKPRLREIHLGGGTPTFFSPQNLEKLISNILISVEIFPDHEFGFEGHPNNTTYQHLETLYRLGFKRVSFGVQDFDEKIQRTINRIQPYENVERVTKEARKLGYQSINFDLVYGLPFQTPEIIRETVQKVGRLLPERIAYYSYAHVPWKMPSQRGYSEKDLPDRAAKRGLYEEGRTLLSELGYHDIGMDHFSLPEDRLFQVWQEGKLHRNFMGYTTTPTDLLVGLGTSSISDAYYAYSQNLKTVEEYQHSIQERGHAFEKGHLLTSEDLAIKRFILDLICNAKAKLQDPVLESLGNQQKEELEVMEKEGLLLRSNTFCEITEAGRPFVRNICKVFDARLKNYNSAEENLFSKAI
jgi:oxygen-independent coproporphyrinogen-3 oxidase